RRNISRRPEFVKLGEPPYTERYVRWCERTGARRPLLLDFQRAGDVTISLCQEWRTGIIFLPVPGNDTGIYSGDRR
ncbi:MAG: hypothetical protein ACOYEK_04430, partial [bacterium]